MRLNLWLSALGASMTILLATGATAQEIKVGLVTSATGPNAAVGLPYKLAAEIFPDTLGGLPVKYFVLDDGSDVNNAVKNARKLVEENKVDVLIGTSSPPGSTAMFEVALSTGTPQLTLAPVGMPPDKQPWIFNVPQPVPLIVSAIVEDLKKKGTKTISFIGFSDIFGDLVINALRPQAEAAGIKILSEERFNRTDTSATAQAIKTVAAGPESVVIGAAATPATLPHLALKDQGFTGQIYHTHGAVSRPVLQAGGKAMEGTLAPTGPIVVANELPDDNPIKKVSLDLTAKYEAKHGKGTINPFAGYAWDAMLLLNAAVPDAAAKAKPGTPEFRAALRDSLQSGREVVGTNGVYKYTEKDHYGLDTRARVLVTVKDGAWRLAK